MVFVLSFEFVVDWHWLRMQQLFADVV